MVAKKPEDPFEDLTANADEPVEEVRLHPILSNEQVLEARAAARKRIDKERIAAAMKALEAEEVERLRIEEGYTTGTSYLDEIVDLTIDVPGWMVLNRAATGLSVNGQPFHYGHTYQVPRHMANSMRESMFNAFRVDDQVEGRDLRTHYGTKRNTVINARSGAIDHAPKRFDA